MAPETIFLFLLASGLLATVLMAALCLRNYLQLRYVRRRLQLTEARLAGYRRRLVVMRGRLPGGRAFPGATGSESGPQVVAPAAEEFPAADLRIRLQQGPARASGTVERYRLVASMARRGLAAEDISAILELPVSETEQLLKLAQVGRAGAEEIKEFGADSRKEAMPTGRI
ncbi:MAG: CGLD27 family protein [Desulfobulbaceae bacterium]|nr:CGLD27 family protein [Desulfobulbaceae bacterium]